MTSKNLQNQILGIETQETFANEYAGRGYQVVVSCLSWRDTIAMQEALRNQGVESKAVALGVLAKCPDPFDSNTLIIWGDEDQRIVAASLPVVEELREKAKDSSFDVRITQASPINIEIAAQQKARKPGM